MLGYMPTGRTRLFQRVKGREVPGWAQRVRRRDVGAVLLEVRGVHPAVTVVTPATSRAEHMVDNMAAARGRVPSSEERRRMVEFVSSAAGCVIKSAAARISKRTGSFEKSGSSQ